MNMILHYSERQVKSLNERKQKVRKIKNKDGDVFKTLF